MMYERVGETKREREKTERENLMNWVVNQPSKTC
jgi:hypothetical protein